MVSKLRMKTDARLANLADKMTLPADQLDALVLTKAHFTEANTQFRGSRKLFDANGNASIHAAKRAQQGF